MDDDGEVDSQSEVVVGSLSWWMMKSLWQEDTLPEQKLRLSLPDTVLLQDGHLLHWFFTSAKSGNILKAGFFFGQKNKFSLVYPRPQIVQRATKRLEWDELLKFLVRRASSTTSKGKHTKGQAPHATSGDIVATARRLREGRTYPVMLTARDLISLREKHNAHLLDEIVAIQPFVAKDPFTGCGVFEIEFERKGQNNHTTQAVVATYELLRWPESDVNWFRDVDEFSVANSSQRDGNSFAPQRARDGSAKRVYGVIHRMLAATTKRIIEHVERATGEILLTVVAQFVFRPGTGQPTLLWLDSVRTVNSKQQLNDRAWVDFDNDPNSKFMRLTQELGEGNRSWTTFFPPKIGDIVSGRTGTSGIIGASLSGGSTQSEYPHNKRTTSASPATCHRSNEVSPGNSSGESYSSCVALNEARDRVFDSAATVGMGDYDEGVISQDQDPEREPRGGLCPAGRYRHTGDAQKENFTLPTEAWVHHHRSARPRSDRSSENKGEGTEEQSLKEHWPRKRSTGTTMRTTIWRDGFRNRSEYLRSVADRQRPWTCPVSRTGGKGCFGDYCHYKDAWSSNRSSGSSSNGTRRAAGERGSCRGVNAQHSETNSSPISKVVSFRSILKSRAEEKALSAWSFSSPSPQNPRVKAKPRTGGCKGEREHLPILGGFGEGGGHNRQAKRGNKPSLASLIAERMRLLAAGLSDRGGGQYSSLRSSDRSTAGAPEVTQQAVEELLYEESLSHLHPTTATRAVTVCDTCAMVYGYMDTFRAQTKQIKAASSESNRLARIALSRGLRDRSRPAPVKPEDEGHAQPLRRYSNLNLEITPDHPVPRQGAVAHRTPMATRNQGQESGARTSKRICEIAAQHEGHDPNRMTGEELKGKGDGTNRGGGGGCGLQDAKPAFRV